MSVFSSDNSRLQQLFDPSREADLAGDTHKMQKSAKTSCGNVFARTNRPLEIPPSPSSRGVAMENSKTLRIAFEGRREVLCPEGEGSDSGNPSYRQR
jgi:hypothetical protein